MKPAAQDGDLTITPAAVEPLRAAQGRLSWMAAKDDGITVVNTSAVPAHLDIKAVEAAAALMMPALAGHELRKAAAARVRVVRDQRDNRSDAYAACDTEPGTVFLFSGVWRTAGEGSAEQEHVFKTLIPGLVIDSRLPSGEAVCPPRHHTCGLIHAAARHEAANLVALGCVGSGSCGARVFSTAPTQPLTTRERKLLSSCVVPLIFYVTTRRIPKGEPLLVSCGGEQRAVPRAPLPLTGRKRPYADNSRRLTDCLLTAMHMLTPESATPAAPAALPLDVTPATSSRVDPPVASMHKKPRALHFPADGSAADPDDARALTDDEGDAPMFRVTQASDDAEDAATR